jgi:hypothetical protein
MAEKKRYRAVVGQGLTSHPTKRPWFVGYERVSDKSARDDDFVVPGGHRYRWMPEGEVLTDSVFLRDRVRDGSLEVLPLELPATKVEKSTPKRGAESEV